MKTVTLLCGTFLAASALACSSPDEAPPAPAPGGGSGGVSGGGSAGTPAGGGGATAGSSGGGVGGSSGGTAGGGAGGTGGTVSTSLLDNPLGPMPATIKETGLFPAAPDLSQHDARMIEYVPDPPLWSDGMEKQRFMLLPAGTQIDNTERQSWEFPEGTVFIKTFFDDSGAAGAPRPIETRLIRLGMNGVYQYFLYQWNADGSDANLVVNDIEGDAEASVPVNITINRMVDGAPLMINDGQPFEHTLPSRSACGDCHTKNGKVRQTFIGFDEVRLNSKLTPDAATTQLQAIADAGLFTQPLPADPETITDASADSGRLLRIKRFIFGNCVTCHNGDGNVDFNPDVFVENTVGKPTEAQSVMPPEGWLRVVAGDPLTSVLYVQMQRTMIPEPDTTRLRPMPPIGLNDVAVEQTSLQDVFDWITSLPP